MIKIGDKVKVSFEGILEMEELKGDVENSHRMCRVCLPMPDGRFCVALVAKEFVQPIKAEVKDVN